MGLLDQISFAIDRLLGGGDEQVPDPVVGWAVAGLDKGRLTSVAHGYGLFPSYEDADDARAQLAEGHPDWVYLVIPIFAWDGS